MKLNLGQATPKQAEFYNSTAKYTGYGGARGGGKSHALRINAILGAVKYTNSRTLIVRKTYPELEGTLIAPFLRLLDGEAVRYNGSKHEATFLNGSTVKFGHFNGMGSELEYQGQEFDRIMVDEATQLTEREFRLIGACLRGTGACPKQMFLTANPGGVGHFWFKRLFVDGHFNEGEDASEYRFIPATLDDNPFLLTATPDYARSLELLPEDVRRAHRYGDWEAAGGRFFTEFTPNMHVVNGFTIPQDWVHYRAFDYGLDMLACLWIAVSPEGIAYVYRELERSGLVVSEACKLIRELTSADEKIVANAAPPDIWSRTKDSGRTMAELFRLGGVTPNRAGNERVSGWMHVKELLRGRLLIFDSCSRLIECLGLIQTSPNNPNDCASTPHNLTHICDALRYFTALRYVNPMVDESDYELPDMVSYNGYNT